MANTSSGRDWSAYDQFRLITGTELLETSNHCEMMDWIQDALFSNSEVHCLITEKIEDGANVFIVTFQ